MTRDEQKALVMIQGGLELLRNAIVKGDPSRELEFRARDLLAETQAIIDGKAAAMTGFKLGTVKP